MLKAVQYKLTSDWDEEFSYMRKEVIKAVEAYVIDDSPLNLCKMEQWLNMYISTAKDRSNLDNGRYLYVLMLFLKHALEIQEKSDSFQTHHMQRRAVYGSVIERLRVLHAENSEIIMGGAMKTLRDKK